MSNQLPYRLELENRRAIVALLPELNEVPWADIERVGSDIISKIQSLPSPHLLVDLCGLNYMGSAQVALVVRMFKTIKEKNGKMVVANKDPMVLEVLSLAGLNKVWTIVDSRERALSMLGGGGGSRMSSSGTGGGMAGETNPLPGIAAIVAVVAAAIFAVIHLANPALIPSRGDLFGILGGSAVAFLAALWAMNGGNKALGIGVLVASVALLLYGVFEIAKPQASTPAPTDSQSEEAKGEKPQDDGSAIKKKKDASSGGIAPAAAPRDDGIPPVNPGGVDPNPPGASPPGDIKAVPPATSPSAAAAPSPAAPVAEPKSTDSPK